MERFISKDLLEATSVSAQDIANCKNREKATKLRQEVAELKNKNSGFLPDPEESQHDKGEAWKP